MNTETTVTREILLLYGRIFDLFRNGIVHFIVGGQK